jgi:ComF family protein
MILDFLQGTIGTTVELLWPRPRLSTQGVPRVGHPLCERCGEPFVGDITSTFICTNCWKRTWSLEWARATYRAEGIVRESIHRMKYQGDYSLLEPLTDWLEEGYEEWARLIVWDALVPVPLHPRRFRERGFNQAAELARRLGERQGLQVWDCLKRTEQTDTQAKLSRAARLRNLRRAFELKKPFDVRGKALLIIDDVFTTGATTDRCARVLREGGAAYVACLTVARG